MKCIQSIIFITRDFDFKIIMKLFSYDRIASVLKTAGLPYFKTGITIKIIAIQEECTCTRVSQNVTRG